MNAKSSYTITLTPLQYSDLKNALIVAVNDRVERAEWAREMGNKQREDERIADYIGFTDLLRSIERR